MYRAFSATWHSMTPVHVMHGWAMLSAQCTAVGVCTVFAPADKRGRGACSVLILGVLFLLAIFVGIGGAGRADIQKV